MSALIVGCGYLGLRVAQAWVSAGRKVSALTRGRADELRAHGVEPMVGDVLDPHSLHNIMHTDTLLYAVGLDRGAGRSMREVYVEGLANVIEALASSERCASHVKRRFIYISSTSVYGQTDGSWVDETSPTEPLEESGRVVLEAERTLRQFRPDALILRFAGIYGPGRVLRKASLLKGEPVPGDPERFLNLIHVEDGVRAVLAAESHAEPGETYLIADDHPPTRREFFTRTAEVIAAPPVRFDESAGGAGEANRRVSNANAKQRLGFQPLLPSYREGLASCL
jgi:nucleoside-diphosphate-sugar epimerase